MSTHANYSGKATELGLKRLDLGEPFTLTYGTFDLLHYGHVRLLSRARTLGLPVAVGLSTEKFNSEKNKQSVMSYEERAELLLQIVGVELVFPENSWNQKENDVVNLNAKYLIMGSDWAGKFDQLSKVTKVIYFDRTEEISSSEIKEIRKLKQGNSLNEL